MDFLISSYVQGLMDQGVPSLKLDSQLLQECQGHAHEMVPIVVYSALHRGILRAQSFETLITMRDRIWRDLQVKYAVTDLVR
jgi:hypothetical protein